MSKVTQSANPERSRQNLMETKATLQAEIFSLKSQLRSGSEKCPDGGEHAVLFEARESIHSLLRTKLSLVGKIDQALEMINLGTWGICKDCEEPISRSRMQAMPTAVRCISCEEKVERKTVVHRDHGKGRSYGSPTYGF